MFDLFHDLDLALKGDDPASDEDPSVMQKENNLNAPNGSRNGRVVPNATGAPRQRRVGQYSLNQPQLTPPTAVQPKTRRHTHHSAPTEFAEASGVGAQFYDDTLQRYTSPMASMPDKRNKKQKNAAPAPPNPAAVIAAQQKDVRQRRHTQYTMANHPSMDGYAQARPQLSAIVEEPQAAKSKAAAARRMRAFSTPDTVSRDMAVKQFYHEKIQAMRKARKEVWKGDKIWSCIRVFDNQSAGTNEPCL